MKSGRQILMGWWALTLALVSLTALVAYAPDSRPDHSAGTQIEGPRMSMSPSEVDAILSNPSAGWVVLVAIVVLAIIGLLFKEICQWFIQLAGSVKTIFQSFRREISEEQTSEAGVGGN